MYTNLYLSPSYPIVKLINYHCWLKPSVLMVRFYISQNIERYKRFFYIERILRQIRPWIHSPCLVDSSTLNCGVWQGIRDFFENPITYRYPNYALFWLYHISPLEKSLISNEKTAVFSAKRPRSGSVLGKLDVATHIAWSYLVVLPIVGWWKNLGISLLLYLYMNGYLFWLVVLTILKNMKVS